MPKFNTPDDSSIIARIGRRVTPGERGLQLAREDAEFFELLSFNLFESEGAVPPGIAAERWKRMTEEQRAPWSQRVLVMLREGAEADADERAPADTLPPKGGYHRRHFKFA